MQTLTLGSTGPLVTAWQEFLRGKDLFHGEVTGRFEADTAEASKQYQVQNVLKADGIVGNQTFGRAMLDGFELIKSPATGQESPNWPEPPTRLQPASLALRQEMFGAFNFQPAPTSFNPEGIKILGNWTAENIQTVVVPQLIGVTGANGKGYVQFHKAAVPQLLALWKAWEDAGLLDRVLTYAGSWVPRFVRGSRTSLSNHAWGTAFDINAAWNGLRARPALLGQPGCVRELVPLANEHGFWWGGHFERQDGMHFECAKLL